MFLCEIDNIFFVANIMNILLMKSGEDNSQRLLDSCGILVARGRIIGDLAILAWLAMSGCVSLF